MATKVQRNSSIELLRILCMVQVIFLHVCNHGGYTGIAGKLGGQTELVYWILMFLSRCPVFVFMIISGYFSCTGQTVFPKKKLINTYLPVIFYSLSIPLVVYSFNLGKVSEMQWARSAFPLLSRTWYFMTLYVVVLLLSPFINKAVSQLSRKEYLYLLGILFFILSVWQFVSKMPRVNEIISTKNVLATEGGKSIYDFVFMYLIGGYLRLHGLFKKPINRWWYALVFLVCGFINVGIVYALPKASGVLLYNDNPFCVIQCVCLFEFFRSFQFNSKFVNVVSACNIGIYMFHDHPLIRKLIWARLDASEPAFYDSPTYLLKIALFILIVFVGSGFIEYIRQWLFKGCSMIPLLWKETPQKPKSDI